MDKNSWVSDNQIQYSACSKHKWIGKFFSYSVNWPTLFFFLVTTWVITVVFPALPTFFWSTALIFFTCWRTKNGLDFNQNLFKYLFPVWINVIYYSNKNSNFVTCMKLQSRLAGSRILNLELQFRYTACVPSSYK